MKVGYETMMPDYQIPKGNLVRGGASVDRLIKTIIQIEAHQPDGQLRLAVGGQCNSVTEALKQGFEINNNLKVNFLPQGKNSMESENSFRTPALMPYFIITEKIAVIIDLNFEQAILYKDKETVDLLTEVFDKAMNRE